VSTVLTALLIVAALCVLIVYGRILVAGWRMHKQECPYCGQLRSFDDDSGITNCCLAAQREAIFGDPTATTEANIRC
jgi:hypothetical protein